LAAIFFFSSLIFYILSYKRLFYLLLAGLCLFLSLLSKEVAIVLPILILGFDLISRRLISRTNLIKYTILGLITLFYFYVRSKTYLALGDREKARIHAESALRNANTQDIVNEARSILQMK